MTAVNPHNAGTARADHFDPCPVAEPDLLEPMDRLRAARNQADGPAFSAAQQMKRDVAVVVMGHDEAGKAGVSVGNRN